MNVNTKSAEFNVSYDAVKHLDKWLCAEFPDQWLQLREAMLCVIADDEEYWTNRSLWCAYDEALKTINSRCY